MGNCGCNTPTDLIDKNTVKCKEQACSENTDLVSLVLITESLGDKLTEFETVFDDFQTAMTEFCASETAKFTTIKGLVDSIVVNNTECCLNTNRKWREILDLVDEADIGELETTTGEVTTTSLPTTTEFPTTTSEPTTTLYHDCCYPYFYNGYSIEGVDANSIANTDWRVPTKGDWTQIYQGTPLPSVSTYVGMGQYKSVSDLCINWNAPNTGALNTLGLNILPVGNRVDWDGTFTSINYFVGYSYGNVPTDEIDFIFDNADAISSANGSLKYGNPVRLVKDAVGIPDGTTTTYIGNNGRVYDAVCKNELYIITENLRETLYRNGSPITKITDAGTWMDATSGAYCVYEDSEELCYTIEPTTTGL